MTTAAVNEHDQVAWTDERWARRAGVVVAVCGDWCDVMCNDDQVVEQMRVDAVEVVG